MLGRCNKSVKLRMHDDGLVHIGWRMAVVAVKKSTHNDVLMHAWIFSGIHQNMSRLDQQLVADCLLQRFLVTSAAYLALPLAAVCNGNVPALMPQGWQCGDACCEVSDVRLSGA
mgnify:CR=1 FL=1